MYVATFLGILAATYASTINITSIDYHPGIYFEELGRVELYSTEWKVILYYDLKTLDDALTHITAYVQKIIELCETVKHTSSFSVICDGIVTETNHIMHDINQKTKLLQGGKRYKRALFGAIGIISKAAFGTLNEEDAKYYDRQIDKIQSSNYRLLNLIKNQTIIIETTANIFNKSQVAIENQIVALDAKFSKVKIMIEELFNESHDQRVFSEMESLTSLATLVIMRYQHLVDTLIDVITDVRHGRPHPAIVTLEQLENILITIRKELPDNIRLPTNVRDNNLLPLYHISHISASILNGKIIYELKIPLPFKENYLLFKAIPLPASYECHFVFIQPSISNIVIDYNKEHYYDMTDDELGTCITEDHNQFLCRMTHPIFSIGPNTNNCEVQLLKRGDTMLPSCDLKESNHATTWIQLSQANKWLYSTLYTLTADYICGDKIVPYTLS